MNTPVIWDRNSTTTSSGFVVDETGVNMYVNGGRGRIWINHYKTSGKHYCEIHVTRVNGAARGNPVLGVVGVTNGDIREYPVTLPDNISISDFGIVRLLVDIDNKKFTALNTGFSLMNETVLQEHDRYYVFAGSVSDGGTNRRSNFNANFGATEFDAVTSSPSNWLNRIIAEGYVPYDIDNANWFFITKHLVKYGENIYSIFNKNLLKIEDSPNNDLFLKYGIDDITILNQNYSGKSESMNFDKDLGAGKVFKKRINLDFNSINIE